MEVPKPQSVYNGAQRGAAVVASDVASDVGRQSVYKYTVNC